MGCSCSSRTSRCRTTCRAAVVQHGGVEAAEAEYGDDTAGGLSSYLHRSLSSLRIRRGCNAANGNKQIAPCLPPVVHLRLPPVAMSTLSPSIHRRYLVGASLVPALAHPYPPLLMVDTVCAKLLGLPLFAVVPCSVACRGRRLALGSGRTF